MSSSCFSLRLLGWNGGIIPLPDRTADLITSAESPLISGPTPAFPPGWQPPHKPPKTVAPALASPDEAVGPLGATAATGGAIVGIAGAAALAMVGAGLGAVGVEAA